MRRALVLFALVACKGKTPPSPLGAAPSARVASHGSAAASGESEAANAAVAALEKSVEAITTAGDCVTARRSYDALKARPPISTPELSRAVETDAKLSERRRTATEAMVSKLESCR